MAERMRLSKRDTSSIKKAIIFDRDGVIDFKPSEADYVKSMYELRMNPAFYEVFSLINPKTSISIVVTNQRGIKRGLYTHEDLEDISDLMNRYLDYYCSNIMDCLYYCPHGSGDLCDCRKPNPGMFVQALNDYNIDPSMCFVVGDSQSDIDAANTAGISNTCLVETDNPAQAIETLKLFLYG